MPMAIPMVLADATPVPESNAAAAGTGDMAARNDHVHPRLSSAKLEILDASGLVTTTFTRSFDTEPCAILTAIAPGGTQPVVLQVDSWIKTGALWTGAVIKGYRGQSNTLAAVTVVAVSVAVGSQTVTPFVGTGAAGVKVSCVFLHVSG